MWKRPKKTKDALSADEAYGYALRLLEVRWRGEEELRARLKEREFNVSAISKAIARLYELKYLDDGRILESRINEYKQFGLYGPTYIAQKLLQRKFKYAQIQEALKLYYPAAEEKQVAKQFLAKQKGIGLEDPKAKQRLVQKCIRRGFSPALIFKLLN